MIWNKCIVHILFAIAACLFWVAAAMSGAVYLLRYGLVSPPNDPGNAANFEAFTYSERLRQRLTTTYLFLGLLFFAVAIVLGFFDANNYWKSSQFWNSKVIFSLFVLIYYFIVVVMIPVLKFKKDQGRGWIVSLFAVAGAAFLLINLILSRFSQIHNYL